MSLNTIFLARPRTEQIFSFMIFLWSNDYTYCLSIKLSQLHVLNIVSEVNSIQLSYSTRIVINRLFYVLCCLYTTKNVHSLSIEYTILRIRLFSLGSLYVSPQGEYIREECRWYWPAMLASPCQDSRTENDRKIGVGTRNRWMDS